MTIRLHVEHIYNCRAQKGERRSKDGRLLKTSISFGETLSELLSEARAAEKASRKLAPNYCAVVSITAYDASAFRADPFSCPPIFEASSL